MLQTAISEPTFVNIYVPAISVAFTHSEVSMCEVIKRIVKIDIQLSYVGKKGNTNRFLNDNDHLLEAFSTQCCKSGG